MLTLKLHYRDYALIDLTLYVACMHQMYGLDDSYNLRQNVTHVR